MIGDMLLEEESELIAQITFWVQRNNTIWKKDCHSLTGDIHCMDLGLLTLSKTQRISFQQASCIYACQEDLQMKCTS